MRTGQVTLMKAHGLTEDKYLELEESIEGMCDESLFCKQGVKFPEYCFNFQNKIRKLIEE